MFLVMFPEVDEKYEIVVCVVHVHVHSKVVYYCNISIAEPISHSYLIPNLTTNSNNSCQPHFLFPPNTNLLNFNRGPAPPSALSFRQPINCIHYLTPSPSNCAHFNLDSHPTDSWSAHEVARKEGPHHISHSKNKHHASLLARRYRYRPLTHESLKSHITNTPTTLARSHTKCLQPCLLPNPSQTPQSRTRAAPAPLGLPRANSCSPPRGPGPAQRSMESVSRWKTLGYALSWSVCLREARV
jgi:hypothetical protein